MTHDRVEHERSKLRPRVGGRGGEVPFQRAPRFCQSVLARAHRRFVRVAGVGGERVPRKGPTRGVTDVPRPRAYARRCVVKALIVKTTARGMKAARLHLTYIERDGVERDGSPGRLYGAADVVDRAALTGVISEERHQFRFIVSPEDEVELKGFVRQLMARVEDDLDVRLSWGAVNHYNTDNPHAHVVVRGVDRAGRQVWIDRAYLTERMRWQAQHVLTEELGPRPEQARERQLDREVVAERLTSADRRLAVALTEAGTADIARLGRVGPVERRRLVGRLQKLETLRLATRVAAGEWRLEPDWQASLRALGERGDVIKRLQRAVGESLDPARAVVIDAGGARPTVEGVVRRKGLHDELRGDAFAVIETPRGQAVYARLDAASAEALVEGSIARISVEPQRWSKPVDRVLERVAREAGGVYDSGAHLEALRRRPLVIQGRSVSPDDVVAVNTRRLARLERYGLVEKIGEGRWRVPADLVPSLEARDASHPRHLVRARTVAPSLREQVARRAPCWLDDQDPRVPLAPFGLGPELRAALRSRERFLESLGLPREPRAERLRALERLERLDMCRKVAARHGATALAEVPPGMRGRLLACGESASGAALACVVDEGGRRVAVLPMPADARPLLGRVVVVGPDGSERPALRLDRPGRRIT